MLIDYISVLGCLPVRAMFAVHCNVAYTPQWALHTAAVGHHRQRQHDHNPWPPRPVVPSQQKAPHCICNCCSIMIAAKQLYKLLTILPAVDIKIIRGLPSIDSNSRKFNSVQLRSVCLSLLIHSPAWQSQGSAQLRTRSPCLAVLGQVAEAEAAVKQQQQLRFTRFHFHCN